MSVYARRSSELKVAYTYPTHHARVRSTLRSDPESHEGKPHSVSESVEVQIWDTRWSATSGDTQRCSGAARTGSEVVLMKVDTTAMKAGTSSKRSHPTKPAPSEHCSHSRAPRTESHHADVPSRAVLVCTPTAAATAKQMQRQRSRRRAGSPMKFSHRGGSLS